MSSVDWEVSVVLGSFERVGIGYFRAVDNGLGDLGFCKYGSQVVFGLIGGVM